MTPAQTSESSACKRLVAVLEDGEDAYTADVADAGQDILQEGFTKVRDQLEAAQESLEHC